MEQQRTPSWHQARCGLVTASRFKDVLAKIKSGEAASRRNYRAQLVCERLTGQQPEGFETAEMRFGREQEPFARMAYEAKTGNIVQEVGFIRHAELMAGCSPDGLILDDGLVEFKVPNTANHLETLLNGMPSDHDWQVYGQMWITDRQWCDFVSYDPRLPKHLQLYIQRVERNEKMIEHIESEVRKFLLEMDDFMKKLPKAA